MKRKCFVCLHYGKIETKTLYARFTWWANGVKYLFYRTPWMRIASQCTIDGCRENRRKKKQNKRCRHKFSTTTNSTKSPRNWLATQTHFCLLICHFITHCELIVAICFAPFIIVWRVKVPISVLPTVKLSFLTSNLGSRVHARTTQAKS